MVRTLPSCTKPWDCTCRREERARQPGECWCKTLVKRATLPSAKCCQTWVREPPRRPAQVPGTHHTHTYVAVRLAGLHHKAIGALDLHSVVEAAAHEIGKVASAAGEDTRAGQAVSPVPNRAGQSATRHPELVALSPSPLTGIASVPLHSHSHHPGCSSGPELPFITFFKKKRSPT